MEEPQFYQKYGLLTPSAYYALNEAISEAKGYNLTDDTARYAPTEPMLAKVDIVYSEEGEESYQTMCVMPITSEVQELYPEVLTGIELVDNFTSCDDKLTEIQVEGFTTSQVDYLLNHFAATSITADVIIAESQPRSAESDQAVEVLVSEGKTIITIDNEGN